MDTARILVVDDDESSCHGLALLLRSERFVVETAGNGEQALSAALRVRPDVVLTDLMMPGMGGVELCARLRASDPDLPVIVTTGSADMQSIGACGAADYLTKPLDIDAVLHVVRRALDASAARVEREALRLHTARMYEEALAAIQSRDEVLSIVSQDLRDSRNVIYVDAQRLSKDALLAQRPDEVRGNAEAILRSTARTGRMIDDFLDGTKIGEQRFRLEPAQHCVADILADVSDLRPLALQKRIRLEVQPVEGDLVLFCDRARIGQVLANLVANAIKFSPDERTVTISAECAHGGVRFVVRDEGPGIAAEKLPHIFERFWQSNAAGRGLGLGLFIAKGIVDAHGGRIWVESRERAGSAFFFCVPAETSVRRACESQTSTLRATTRAQTAATLPPSVVRPRIGPSTSSCAGDLLPECVR